MPHWIVMLAAALGGWFAFVAGAGFVLGRGLDLLSRRRRRHGH
jgi:hypothetical protein